MSFKEWESTRTPSGLGTGRRLGYGLVGACAAAMMLAACANKVVDLPEAGGQGGPSGEDPTGSPGVNPGEPSAGGDECAPGRFARKTVLLSDIQFANAITSLLGPESLPAELQPDATAKPFSQKGVLVNTSLLRARLDAAEAAATSLTGEVGTLSGCAATDDDCARGYIADLAHRAFRRPVTQAELTDLNTVYTLGRETSLEVGVQLATQAIIASPSFSYRTEYGGSQVLDAATGARKIVGTELASLLSFWLTDAPPDEALLTAAESGALDQPGEVGRQVARMLGSQEARNSVTLTLMSAWGMGNIFGNAKDPNAFPEYGPLLQANMFEETRLFLNNALWSGSSTVDQVLTSRRSFVNEALAELYGVPFTGNDPTQFVAVDLPADERAGLLTQPSLLAARARTTDTSVVARGLFVRASLLCMDRPPPPPEDVIAQVQELLAADLTERERADFRAMTSPCKNCHSSIDGFGLMLENYDAIGRYRTELDGQTIDPTVDLGPLGYDGVYNGAVEFVTAAAEDPQFTACLARHLAVYATGEDIVKTRDCELDGFATAVPSEMTLPEIIASLAESPLLTTRSGE